jgi:hypothetical protein
MAQMKLEAAVPGVELFLIEFLRKIPVVIISTDLLYL